MKRILLLALLSALALPLAAASARGSGSGSLVVAEVYAAGGNSGAAYANDYTELFNRGTSPVAIDGRALPRPARLRWSERVVAAGGRRNRHVQPRGHRRKGRSRRRRDRPGLRRL